MNNIPTDEALLAALKDAGHAHHNYETHYLKGEHDKFWAGWYAAFVLGRLGDFTTPTDLTLWLESVPSENDWFDDAVNYIKQQLMA